MTTIIKSKQALVLKEKGNLELWNKNYSNALNLFSEALELDPENIEYHLSKAAVYNLSGLFSNAIKECKITLEKGNKKRKQLSSENKDDEEEEKVDKDASSAASSSSSSKSVDKSVGSKSSNKEKIIELDQILSKAYARMGSAYLGANQLKESRTCVENAIVINSKCVEFEEMLNMVDDLIDFTTTEAKNLFRLANDAYYAKKYQDAVQLYTEAIEIDQNNNILYSNRSMCFNKLKRYTDALSDAQKAIDIENRDSHHSYLPRYAKGNSLYFLGRYQEALESYQDSLKNKPDSPVLLKKIKKAMLKLELSKNKKQSNNNEQSSSSTEVQPSAETTTTTLDNGKKVKKNKKSKVKQVVQPQPVKEDPSIISPPPIPNLIDKSTNSLESNLENSQALQNDYEIQMIPGSKSPSKPTFIRSAKEDRREEDDEEDDPFEKSTNKEYEDKIEQKDDENKEEEDEEEMEDEELKKLIPLPSK